MTRSWVLAACILAAPTAHAGNQDLYGMGARGPGMSGATVAFPRGWESVWYNPAGLIVGGARAFSFGFQTTTFDLSVDSPRPEDVAGIGDEEHISGVTLGVNVRLPLLGALQDRIALGLGLYIPASTLLSARIPEPFAPQFSLVGDRARTVSVQAALALEIAPWLQIGGGIRALAALTGTIKVGPNELGRLGGNVEDQLVARYAPAIGAVGRPHPDWAIGVVWRGELGGIFELPVEADLGDDLPLDIPPLQIAGTAVYDPGQLALHLGWEPAEGWSVEAGVTWRRWSQAPIPIENTTAALPPQEALDFSDTFSPRIGAEGRVDLGAWRLTPRLGYAFEPSPAPDQVGRHNFLDGDRHVTSVGLGLAYGGDGFRIELDAYTQVHIMAPRQFVKTFADSDDALAVTDNAGFPWIGAQGTIISGGASLGIQL